MMGPIVGLLVLCLRGLCNSHNRNVFMSPVLGILVGGWMGTLGPVAGTALDGFSSLTALKPMVFLFGTFM